MNAPFNNQPSAPGNSPETRPAAPTPPEQMPPDRDTSSIQIARVAGIPIRLHFTFLLGLVYFGVMGSARGAALGIILYVLGLFTCVVLHELGHALTARHYGIKTSSITLYPIGGIARIAERPKPAQELWIALAGPAVNVLIALILATIISFRHQSSVDMSINVHWGSSYLGLLLWANVMLFLFNLIPAFPMDGGRVLRAALALWGMPPVRATNIASNIGRLIAVIAGVAAIFYQDWLLMFIAFFIYIGAGQEAQMVRQETVFTGVPLSKVMVTNLETLTPGVTLKDVAERLLHTSQQHFPVVMGDEVVGLLTRDRLLQGLSKDGPDAYVAGTMNRQFRHAEPARELSQIVADAAAAGHTIAGALPLLVLDAGGKLKGMVTAENLAEFFAIQQILGSKAGA